MSSVSIPVPTPLFMELAGFLSGHEPTKDPVEAVSDAISYWLENAAWKADTLLPGSPIAQGYSWKSVHLPTGTMLRIRSGKDFKYARVENDSPCFMGDKVSPNQFAMIATGSARDAWRDVWVKRPGDSDYILANTLRKAEEAASVFAAADRAAGRP